MWRRPAIVAACIGASLLGTAPAPAGMRIRLGVSPGTTQCGGPGLSPAAAPPLTGALYADTGCAAPRDGGDELARCSGRAAGAFARFADESVACRIRQARAVFLAGASSPATSDEAEACAVGHPTGSARARLDRALARLACPAAVADGAAGLRDALLAGPSSFAALNAAVYCDVSAGAVPIDPARDLGAVPGPGTAGGRRVFRCETAAWWNVKTLMRRLMRCRIEAGRPLSRGLAFTLADCEGTALARYDVAAGALAARGICPPCLDAAGQAALRDRVLADARRASGRLYPCAPGGPAFASPVGLGQGCLYLPAGPGAAAPDGAEKVLEIVSLSGSVAAVAGSEGTGPTDCTKGSGPGRHCLNGSGAACASDADCGGAIGACARDANCYFVQPIPVANGPLSLCLVDVIESDESGTVDLATGATAIMEHHASRAYLTGNAASPCPRCLSGLCSGGKNAGAPCAPVGGTETTIQCPPRDQEFVAALQLHEVFTTDTSERVDFGAGFCPGQPTPGAFGRSDARRISVAGMRPGDLRDLAAHPVALASAFCVPPTGIGLFDAVAGLPGAGAVSSAGVVRLE